MAVLKSDLLISSFLSFVFVFSLTGIFSPNYRLIIPASLHLTWLGVGYVYLTLLGAIYILLCYFNVYYDIVKLL